MIGPVQIQNFKSIKDLKFDARRVNVFIGEPNTGKSNILEALTFFAEGTLPNAHEVLRFKTTEDLFYDQTVENEVCVNIIGVAGNIGDWKFRLKFSGERFEGHYDHASNAEHFVRARFAMSHSGRIELQSYNNPEYMIDAVSATTGIRSYRFKPMDSFPNVRPGSLNPPFGDNLVAVLYSNEKLRNHVSSLIESKGFRFQLKPTEMLILKDMGVLYSYPWISVSETLRRIVFFMAVLETNEKKSILLDEPEANTFPFYTSYLAERIALDDSNQFFLTTHNPYLLGSIVAKTQMKDLNVFVTLLENYSTVLKPVSSDGLSTILDYGPDAFLNLRRLVE